MRSENPALTHVLVGICHFIKNSYSTNFSFGYHVYYGRSTQVVYEPKIQYLFFNTEESYEYPRMPVVFINLHGLLDS